MRDAAAIPPLDFVLERYWKIQEKAEDGLSFQHQELGQAQGGKKYYNYGGTSIKIFTVL